jgi:hypothetical protein
MSDLQRLEKLQSWTEEPARAVAESLGQATEAAAAVEPPAAAQEPAQPSVPIKRAGQGALPWDGVPEDVYRQFNVRLPAKLAMQLKWLGDTTFDTSMTKIVTESLHKTVKKMLAERGIK